MPNYVSCAQIEYAIWFKQQQKLNTVKQQQMFRCVMVYQTCAFFV